MTREVLVGSLEEAQKGAADIGYPIVLKGSGPDIIHKTELGLIKLNLRDGTDLNKAFGELMNNPRVTPDRLLGRRMVQGDRKLIECYRQGYAFEHFAYYEHYWYGVQRY